MGKQKSIPFTYQMSVASVKNLFNSILDQGEVVEPPSVG